MGAGPAGTRSWKVPFSGTPLANPLRVIFIRKKVADLNSGEFWNEDRRPQRGVRRMKFLVLMLAFAVSSQADAQTNQGNNLQAVPANDPAAMPAQEPSGETQIAPGQASGNPIYILNNQRQGVSQA